jgi:hypothetical protein
MARKTLADEEVLQTYPADEKSRFDCPVSHLIVE